VLRHFSRRRAEIVAWLEAEDRAGRQSAEKAALATREPKAQPVALAPWCQRVRAEAAEHGFGHRELAVLTGRERASARGVELESVGARLAGSEGLTAQRTSFEARHAIVELAAAHRDGAVVGEVERATGAFLGRRDVVALVGAPGERRYTTASLLACERQIVADATRGYRSGAGVVDGELVGLSLAALPMRLSAEQAAVVRAIVTSGNAVDVVEALAGTGKTTVAGALAAVYHRAGYRVVGAAPTGRAARELSSRAGMPASTLHRLADRLSGGDAFGPGPAVLLVDEAGMAPTRISAEVLAAASREGVKVVALGDSGQLSSVEAGGWLGALSRRLGARELRSVGRQRDKSERDALAQLHDGRPAHWIALKQSRGELVVHHGGPPAAQEAAMAAWRADVDAVGIEQAVMIARDNATRARLNQEARAWRQERGRLCDALVVGGLEVAVGDRVIARRNDRDLDIDNGTRGTVRAVDPAQRAVSVETDTGQLRELPADYLAAHVEHAYALTAHGSQGATVERAVVIGTPEDFTNEWAYTALSRARDPVSVHLAAKAPDRTDRAEIAPVRSDRTGEEAITAMRAAMGRREREELAVDQVDRQQALTERAPVAGEAAAEAIERAQRRQLSLDLDSPSRADHPVPEALPAVREPAPLWTVEHNIGLDATARQAIERARNTLGGRPQEELAARAERLDALLKTFLHQRVEAARRVDELTRLRADQGDAHERIGEQRARLDHLGPLSRLTGRRERELIEHALATWADRAEELDEQVRLLEHHVDVDRHERAAWFDEHGGELVQLAAANLEMHDRELKARERRIDDIRRDPPEWVTDRLGPRPDEPVAREHWDRAAAHLDDYRQAFGHPPNNERSGRGDYRERDAWKQVHEATTKALEVHPERPLVPHPPPQLQRDIGLGLDL
jgi:AAA domain